MVKIIRYLFIAFVLVGSAAKLTAQDNEAQADKLKYWKYGGFTSLQFNQISFSNWARGGENSISLSTVAKLNSKYEKDNIIWDNTADFTYSFQYSEELDYRKNEDKIDLNSKFGYQAAENLFYSFLLGLRTQFDKGYNYPNDSVYVSDFFAPAYLLLSLGLDYKPSDHLSLYISPTTGRFIFVTDSRLADQGAFGVNPAIYDDEGNKIQDGENFSPDFGAYFKGKLEYDIMENITLNSALELFNNYTDKNVKNRDKIDVNWESNLLMKINKFFSAGVFVHLIYDHDIEVPLYETIDGEEVQTGTGPRLQLMQSLGLGLSYKF
ncbi:MAG: DUF3078 domain-containing protein [Candidatus Kapaibacterium sp.]